MPDGLLKAQVGGKKKKGEKKGQKKKDWHIYRYLPNTYVDRYLPTCLPACLPTADMSAATYYRPLLDFGARFHDDVVILHWVCGLYLLRGRMPVWQCLSSRYWVELRRCFKLSNQRPDLPTCQHGTLGMESNHLWTD